MGKYSSKKYLLIIRRIAEREGSTENPEECEKRDQMTRGKLAPLVVMK
jgi:hypothetical protein